MQTNLRNSGHRAMHPFVVAVFVFVFAVAIPMPQTHAQDRTGEVTDMQALRNAMKTDKRAYIEKTLALTSAEAKRFWPIYDGYERVMEDTSRRRVVALKDLVFRDSPTTSLAAKNLTQELVSIYDTEAKARLRVARRAMKALPPVKAARFLQLEDKMLAVRDYDEASAVPLIR